MERLPFHQPVWQDLWWKYVHFNLPCFYCSVVGRLKDQQTYSKLLLELLLVYTYLHVSCTLRLKQYYIWITVNGKKLATLKSLYFSVLKWNKTHLFKGFLKVSLSLRWLTNFIKFFIEHTVYILLTVLCYIQDMSLGISVTFASVLMPALSGLSSPFVIAAHMCNKMTTGDLIEGWWYCPHWIFLHWFYKFTKCSKNFTEYYLLL